MLSLFSKTENLAISYSKLYLNLVYSNIKFDIKFFLCVKKVIYRFICIFDKGIKERF